MTSLLTIVIAVAGYRLILGHVPDIREGVLFFVRIGLVLALATSWEAYRTVVYDVALKAPGEIAAEIGGAVRIPGTAGLMGGHLDAVDQQFQTLAIAGVGGPVRFDVAQQYPPPLFAGFDTFALGASRTAFMTGVLGALGSLRLLAGILLALGPLFIGFLLFDATRGLFEGWLKALAGAALGSLIVSIMLGVELALLEPWLNQLVERRNAGEAILMAPSQLLALSTVFALFLLASVALGFRLVHGGSQAVVQITRTFHSSTVKREGKASAVNRSVVTTSSQNEGVSRASLLAESVHRLDQRHSMRAAATTGSSAVRYGTETYGHAAASGSPRQATATTRRRDPRRSTASAARRDRTQ
ncbi:MAG: type IV secretion system protein [Chloroflexota bacterium]|nr:type IV secretion system protein [Chloroflexota bacterium]